MEYIHSQQIKYICKYIFKIIMVRYIRFSNQIFILFMVSQVAVVILTLLVFDVRSIETSYKNEGLVPSILKTELAGQVQDIPASMTCTCKCLQETKDEEICVEKQCFCQIKNETPKLKVPQRSPLAVYVASSCLFFCALVTFIFCQCTKSTEEQKYDGVQFDSHVGTRELEIYDAEAESDDDGDDGGFEVNKQMEIERNNEISKIIREKYKKNMRVFSRNQQAGVKKLFDKLFRTIIEEIKVNNKDLYTQSVQNFVAHVKLILPKCWLLTVQNFDSNLLYDKCCSQIRCYRKLLGVSDLDNELSPVIENLLKEIITAGIIAPAYSARIEKQVHIYQSQYHQKIALELIPFHAAAYKTFSTMELIQRAEKNILRQISWKNYNSQLLVTHFNILVQEIELNQIDSLSDIDYQNLVTMRKIVEKMIVEYTQFEKIQRLDNETLMNELVQLSEIKDFDLYRKVLQALYIDINTDGAALNVHKLQCLAQTIINGAMSSTSKQPFINGDDLNGCANLIRQKLDTITGQDDADQVRNIEKCFDVLVTILRIMAMLQLKGLSEANYRALKKSLDTFSMGLAETTTNLVKQGVLNKIDGSSSAMTKMVEQPYNDIGVELLVHKTGLTTRAMMAQEALKRAQASVLASLKVVKNLGLLGSSLQGVATLSSGIFKADFSQVGQGLSAIGGSALEYYNQSEKDWYDQVEFAIATSVNNFDVFCQEFFEKDFEPKIVEDADDLDRTDSRVLTFYVLKQLDSLVRNRTERHRVRMTCLTYFAYVYSNKNLARDTPLDFANAPAVKFFIKQSLAIFCNMPVDESNKTKRKQTRQLRHYAKTVLTSLHEDSPEADQYIEKLVANGRDTGLGNSLHFDFSDFESKEGTALIVATLAKQLPFESLLSDLQNRSSADFDRDLSTLNKIDVFGIKYIDGGKQFDASRKEAVCDIDDCVGQFLRSKKRSMLVQGPSGSGKTTLLQEINFRQWRAFKVGASGYLPVFVSLREVKRANLCVDDVVRHFSPTYSQKLLRDSSKAVTNDDYQIKYLIIFDGYDELNERKNILETNRFHDWSPNTKFLFSCKDGFLEHYDDYTQFFLLPGTEGSLLEFRIADVSAQQINQYFSNSNVELESGLAPLELIEKVRGVRHLIRTVKMMSVVEKILPQLDQQIDDQEELLDDFQPAEQDAYVEMKVYQNYMQQYFEAQMTAILEQEEAEIPQNFDLLQSFENFSCSLAIEMWIKATKSVTISSSNYPFPSLAMKLKKELNQFQQFFSEDDPYVTIARQGAPLTYGDGRVQFAHNHLMIYFVSKVIFEEIKATPSNFTNTYLDVRLIDHDDNYINILEFVAGHIIHSMIQDKKNMGETKLEKHVVKVLNSVDQQTVEATYMRNLLRIAAQFEHLICMLNEEATNIFLADEEILDLVKEKILWCKAAVASKAGQEYESLQLRALGYQMGGKYEGAYQLKNENSEEEVTNVERIKIEAHGLGEITFKKTGNRYIGLFQNNKMHGEDGTFEYAEGQGGTRNSTSVRVSYKGDFKDGEPDDADATISYKGGAYYRGSVCSGQRSGKGFMTYAVGVEYNGGFLHDQKNGEAVMTSPEGEFQIVGQWTQNRLEGHAVVKFEEGHPEYQGSFQGHFKGNVCEQGELVIGPGNTKFGSLELQEDYSIVFTENLQAATGNVMTYVIFKQWAGIEEQAFGQLQAAQDYFNSLPNYTPRLLVQNEKIIASYGKADELKDSFLNPTIDGPTPVPPTPRYSARMTPGGIKKPFSSLFLVIKVQAMVRGFLQRRRFHNLKQNVQLIDTARLFRAEELEETLQEFEQFRADTPLEQKTHTYGYSKAVYSGQMSGGFRHGQGTMTWSSGAKYEGEWSQGHASGKGKLDLPDGTKYEGEWLNSKCNGFGQFSDSKGVTYKGNWLNDKLNGQGELEWPDGSKYVGVHKNGQKDGLGKYEWGEGAFYDGDWVENMLQGLGHYQFADGRQFHGQWESNEMHGMGIMDYGDGVVYQGNYAKDAQQGFGILYGRDKKVYEGWFDSGKMHGLVTQTDPGKSKWRKGLWQNGARVVWFSADVIDQIEKGTYDFEQNFKDSETAPQIDKTLGFKRPKGFDQTLKKIKKRFDFE